ncbi:hypothetical protein pb186bvf_016073 [Paramecium bursaria]
MITLAVSFKIITQGSYADVNIEKLIYIKLHYIKMTSMLPDIYGNDYETLIHSQDVNLKQDDGAYQEVTCEGAVHQPNRSISFKRRDQHQKHSNTIKELIDEMGEAPKVELKTHSNLKNKGGKRITMRKLEQLF